MIKFPNHPVIPGWLRRGGFKNGELVVLVGKSNVGKSKLEKVNEDKPCMSSEHNPPMHLYIPPGHQHTHVCPACGDTKVLRPPNVTF